MQQKFLSLIVALTLSIIFTSLSFANVTAPPVNQQIGFPDGVFNNLEETDCRLCHENPEQFPVDPESIPDRHHLLMYTPIGDLNSTPFADPPGNFDCISCHDVDCSTGVCSINVYRDCLFCHQQLVNESSVHHLTSPALNGDCVSCHGDIVDNIGDGHVIATYEPSMVTPRPSGATGLPLNSEGHGAGACDYCHSTGTGTGTPGIDTDTGILVYSNSATHHSTRADNDSGACVRCHNEFLPEEYKIRVCEGCHGYESLHNIQADSDGDGIINPGVEQPFYGHIGDPDDCWGCHGFSFASAALGNGPLIPTISSSNVSVITAGSDTAVTLAGSALTYILDGVQLATDIVLYASDGSTIKLIPDSISEDSITVTIPGTVATGNYDVRVVKNTSKSNPIVINVKPAVTITDVDCRTKRGSIIIKGAGFSKKVEGTDAYINMEVDGNMVDIISWKNNRIKASVSGCSSNTNVRVKSLYGTAANGDDKPQKPCKGRQCK